MPKTWEYWHGLVKGCIYYAYQTHGIYQILPYSMDFKAPEELWNPLSKTVFGKCSFIWNKIHVNILNYHKLKSNLYVGPLIFSLIFYTVQHGYKFVSSCSCSTFNHCCAIWVYLFTLEWCMSVYSHIYRAGVPTPSVSGNRTYPCTYYDNTVKN